MTKKTYRVAPEVKADILKRIKDDGVTVAEAAEQHGLSEKTIYNWLSKGAGGQPTWREFNKLKKEKEQLLSLIGELTIKLSTTPKKS